MPSIRRQHRRLCGVPTPNGPANPLAAPRAQVAAREFRSSAAPRADPVKADDFDHATGLERKVRVDSL